MKPQRGAPPPPGDDRKNRLGQRARGSYDFILLCLRRGVPASRIQAFLLGLGLDSTTAARWVESAVRDVGNDKAKLRPSSVKVDLEVEKTRGKFVLPDIEAQTREVPVPPASDPVQVPKESPNDFELNHEVSLELVEATKRFHGRQVATSGSAMFNGVVEGMVTKPVLDRRGLTPPVQQQPPPCESERVVELQRSGSQSDRKGLRTQTRFMIFGAAVFLTWIVSDGGWAPGGVLRGSALPPPDPTQAETVRAPEIRIEPVPILEPAPKLESQTLEPPPPTRMLRRPATRKPKPPGRRFQKQQAQPRRSQGAIRVPIGNR
jgi:hypothetical protein